MKQVFIYLFAIIFVAVAIILHGGVLSYLWLWFLVPLGLPVLGLAHATGITGIAGFLTNQYNPAPEEKKWSAFAYIFTQPILALIIGYIVHSFM